MILSLCVVHSMRVDSCIITCIYHYDIMQRILSALKLLFALPIHPSIPCLSLPQYLATTLLSFPECHIVEITQNVAI